MAQMDELIKKDVVDQLYWDDRVDASSVQVAVSEGRVILSGTAANYTARQAAELDALSIPGVVRVDNQIQHKYVSATPMPPDDEIRAHIENVLKWNTYVSESDITVEVLSGFVTFKGSVDAFWKKDRIEELALNILGVMEVNNELAVVPTKEIADQVIAESVVSALERNSFIDEKSIEVSVENGQVTLSGNVSDWNVFRTVYDIALYTPGVTAVVNELSMG